MNELPTDYQSFIHCSRYARWNEEEQRRETWEETVSRYVDEVIAPVLDDSMGFEWEVYDAITTLDVMPSMRSLMTAGAALDRDNVAGYNCSYLPVDSLRSFDEAMFILLCGTGVGFSVEAFYTQSLPPVPTIVDPHVHTIVVEDSKEGWATAFRTLLECLFDGVTVEWDTSKVRPAGAKLKTFGGRASGPEPLEDLFRFAVALVERARGRNLTPIECHDLMCKIGEIVVVGGVRRSAMISLSDLHDKDMAMAKSGEWWVDHPYRALANNSAVYNGTPDRDTFDEEWQNLIDSQSGERGIFNREALQKNALKYGRRDPNWIFGTNPCSEISLRPYQFCNLSEVVVRPDDTEEAINWKIRVATIIGTVQSTLTHFPYLRPIWKENTEAERLLGVSLTGIMDNPLTYAGDDLPERLERWRKVAEETNAVIADHLGIPRSAAITCVKPSGTVSQLVDSASGIHSRHSPYYIRTVRGDNKDPLTQFMAWQGIQCEPCVMKPDTTTVFSFPQKSPENAVTRHDRTAIEELTLWLQYQRHYCEHKPSVTISVKAEEWKDVGDFVYEHFDEMSGVSFLPFSDHTYRQAPYQECTKEQYEELVSHMPERIDWSKLSEYEKEDTTKSAQTYACQAGICEIVDIT